MSHALEAIARMRRLGPTFAHLLQVTEIRTVARDRLWLSCAYDADVVGLHFTWVRDLPGVTAVLPAIEDALLPLGARPHWGKLFTADAAALAAGLPEAGRLPAPARRGRPHREVQQRVPRRAPGTRQLTG